MSRDPFDGIIPIRPPTNEPPQLAAVSKEERKQRRKQRAANREPGAMPVAGGTPRRKRLVNTPELEQMVSTLLRQHYHQSKDASRSQDKKNATVAFAVLVDKYNVLHGKPSQIVGFAEAEAARPGLLELAKVIAEGA